MRSYVYSHEERYEAPFGMGEENALHMPLVEDCFP